MAAYTKDRHTFVRINKITNVASVETSSLAARFLYSFFFPEFTIIFELFGVTGSEAEKIKYVHVCIHHSLKLTYDGYKIIKFAVVCVVAKKQY